MKTIACIEKIDAMGTDGLTASLRLLGAMGLRCAVLPTELQAAQPLDAEAYRVDLSVHMLPIARQWRQQGYVLDAIQIGSLSNPAQAECAVEVLRELKTEQTTVSVLVSSVQEAYRRLYDKADLLFASARNACRLTGVAYEERNDTQWRDLLLGRLQAFSSGTAVLYGISEGEFYITCAGQNKDSLCASVNYGQREPDAALLACAFTGSMLCSATQRQAMQSALTACLQAPG